MTGIGLLLLALGFGYKIFAEAANNTKKGLQILGRAIGLFIMIAAVGGMVCRAACMSKSCGLGYYGGKGMMGKKFCAFRGGTNQSLLEPGTTVTVN